MRDETLARQKKLGLVPANTKLTKRHQEIPAWDSLNAEQKQLYAYMMEVYAGYLEQTDYNVGRVLEAIAQLDQLDNTLVIYIVRDNGASAEGSLQGSLNEMLCRRCAARVQAGLRWSDLHRKVHRELWCGYHRARPSFDRRPRSAWARA